MLGKLLQFAPTLVVLSVSGSLLWPYFNRSSPANPTAKASPDPGAPTRPANRPNLAEMLRDPFHFNTPLTAVQAPGVGARKEKTPADARQQELEAMKDVVAGLSLGGTYLNQTTRQAIIGGKIYSENAPILDEDGESTGLVLKLVSSDGVTLAGLGKEFPLGYPTRLESAGAQDESPAQPDMEATLRSLLGSGSGQELSLVQMLMNGQGGLSGVLPALLLNQLQGGGSPEGAVRPAARVKAAKAAANAPVGGDPSLYAEAAANPAKGKKAKASAGPVGGDPALYGDPSGKSGGSKSGSSKAKKTAPVGGDPALYGGDSKKGGRSKR